MGLHVLSGFPPRPRQSTAVKRLRTGTRLIEYLAAGLFDLISDVERDNRIELVRRMLWDLQQKAKVVLGIFYFAAVLE